MKQPLNYLKALFKPVAKVFLMMLILIGINGKIFGQVDVTATAGTTGPTTYSTLAAAFIAINGGIHQGAINILITGNTTEPLNSTTNSLKKSGSGSSSYTSVTIKPSGNVTVTGTTGSAKPAILLYGADNVTIDGDDPGTAGSQNLTITMPNTSATNLTAVILIGSNWSTDPVDNITIKNCNIVGGRNSVSNTVNTYGILMCDGSTCAAGFSGAYVTSSASTILENNIITRSYIGIHVLGNSTTNPAYGTQILNNTLGSATSAVNIGQKGIYVSNTGLAASGNGIISGNDIRVGDYGASGYASSLYGIEVAAGNYGITIDRNKIHDINQPYWSGGAYGIYFSTSNIAPTISNNFIWNIKTAAQSTSAGSSHPDGIWLNGTITGIKLYNNTIVMPTQLYTGAYLSTCVNAANTAIRFTTFSNNIFVNNYASSATYVYLIYTGSNLEISGATNADKNDYYMAVAGKFGGNTTTSYATLTAWQTATSKDANSINLLPPFMSATDLHLNFAGANGASFDGTGATGTGVTLDIDGDTRAPSPCIGADEKFVSSPPIVTSFNPASGCAGIATVTITGDKFSGITAVAIGTTAVTSYTVNSATQITAIIGSGNTGSITVTNSSGTGTSTAIFTVYSIPTVAAIAGGASTVCVGANTPAFTNTTVGGVWSITNGTGSASITAGGVATGITVGTVTVVYSVTTSGCSNTATTPLTVTAMPSITTNPSNVSILSGNNASFTVAASNNPTSYIWEVNNGSGWTTITDGGVYSGANSATLSLTGVPFSMNGYQYRARAVNGCGNSALSTTATLTVGACTTPTTSPTFFSASSIASDTMAISWSRTNPIGTNVLVVARAITAPTDPVNGITYNADAAYGIGSPCGGGFVVYNGTGTSVNVTNLTSSTTYYYAIYEFNACDGGNYFMTELTGSATTLSTTPSSNLGYNFTAVAGTFTPNGAGTNTVCTTSCDSYTSTEIPLNFTFNFGNCVTTTAYDAVVIGSNGWISLGRTTSADNYPSGTYANPFTNPTPYNPVIAPFADDLIHGTGCSINYKTTGSSPNRVFTVEWLNVRRWSAVPDFSFQVKLYETSNKIEFVYGTNVTPNGSTSAAVGLCSGAANDYYTLRNLSTSPIVDYGAPATETLVAFPATGQIYRWELPTPMVYVSSSVTQASTVNTFPSATNQAIIGVQITVSGSCSPINLTQLKINMNGSTSIADVSNIDVYYTGTSSGYASNEIFGNISPASGVLTITGSKTLLPGTNYFWIVYDLASSAVIGDVVDAECSQITVNSVTYAPTGNPPAGSRPIADIPPTFAKWIELGRSWAVIPTSDGNILWAGTTTNTYGFGNGDAYFIKTSPDLETIHWTRVLGYAGSSEVIKDVVETSDGFIGIGATNYSGNDDIMTIKINLSGVPVWVKSFEHVGLDEGSGICLTADGNVAICGTIADPLGYVAKLNNSDGAIIAQKNLDITSGGVYLKDIQETTATDFKQTAAGGEFIVGGYTSTNSNDFYVAKLKSDLTFSWGKTWGGATSTDNINFVTENGNNDFTIAGTTNLSSGWGGRDGYAMRFTVSAGSPSVVTVNWVNTYGTTGENNFNKGIKTSDGGYAMAGITTRLGDALNDEAFVAKINSDGSNSFMKSIGTTSTAEDQEAYGIAQLSADNYAVAGLNNHPGNSFYMMKVGAGGLNCSAVQDNGGVKSLSIPVITSNGTVSNGTLVTIDRTASISSGVGGIITGGCNTLIIPLPLELLFFTGYNNNTVNVLKWSTASETNNDYFTIERSRDGLIWEVLGKVKGAGTSNETNDYSLTDYSPFSSITYYRLKQTDFDGTTKTSDVISLECCGKVKHTNYYLYPNPTVGDFTIKAIKAIEQGAIVEVINSIGQKVIEKTITGETNNLQLSLNSDFSSGVYFVLIKHNNEVLLKQKVIKE